jgi:glucose-1-phosphate cytidylyltransferase
VTHKQNVPVFILAGGLGTRISEETELKPKPMVEVGQIPLLVHLMRWYYAHGFHDFVICGGYKAWEIKSYFLNYEFRMNHLVVDHRDPANPSPPGTFGTNAAQERWRVRVIDTGLDCMTGGRVARALDEIDAGGAIEDFALTYGDGLSDVDLDAEFAFHKRHGRLGTILGVQMLARFGELGYGADGVVSSFLEKPESKQGLINGGFFFFRRDFRRYLDAGPDCVLELAPLAKLVADNQLMLYPHRGFWQPMDTLRDRTLLQRLWDSGRAPWKVEPAT